VSECRQEEAEAEVEGVEEVHNTTHEWPRHTSTHPQCTVSAALCIAESAAVAAVES
jgi:hypothetical protein